MSAEPAILIEQLLASAGITPRPDELATLVAATPGRLAAIEALYAVEEARDEEPGLVFTVEPPSRRAD